MPRVPRGERRSSDVTGNAVHVMTIATGEIEDDREDVTAPSPTAQLGRLGGIARAASTTASQRAEIARKAAKARWQKK